MIRRPGLHVFLLTLGAGACASGSSDSGSAGISSLTENEIRASEAENALQLIQEERPSWLLKGAIRDPSDPQGSGGPIVLVNDIPTRPLFTLQFQELANVREIRYLTRTHAETRYRVNAPHGAILVLTRHPSLPGDSLKPDTGQSWHPRYGSSSYSSLANPETKHD